MDVDERNLEPAGQLVVRDLEARGMPTSMLSTATDRRLALRDGDYVFNTVRTGGLDSGLSTTLFPTWSFGQISMTGTNFSHDHRLQRARVRAAAYRRPVVPRASEPENTASPASLRRND